MIKRCNDFGAGGVSVAIGELTDGLIINLDKVPKKYEGLDGTELAISESQERMAVVVAQENAKAFCQYAEEENLEASLVADVTANNRLQMSWRNATIVDISRDFLNTNGVRQETAARVAAPSEDNYFNTLPPAVQESTDLETAWLKNLAALNVCSQKGLVERFDSTIGAGTVLMPFGGKYQLTPAEGMAAKVPVLNGETSTATLMTFGYNPELATWSPFHGALYAVIESVAKIVALGGDYRSIRLTLQEYFEKLGQDAEKWGKPLSALLGAFYAQKELGIPAIGGKDSMSGTFKDMHVPPTLVSFAVDVAKTGHIISQEFKKIGSQVVVVKLPRDNYELPDFDALRANYQKITALAAAGKVLSAYTVRLGGVAAAVSKMSFGNKIGLKFADQMAKEALFSADYGSIVLELPAAINLREAFGNVPYVVLGITQQEAVITVNETKIAIDEAIKVWENALESVFPTQTKLPSEKPHEVLFTGRSSQRCKTSFAKPRIFIPVFPGTNCEYDSAAAFNKPGGIASTLVVRNLTSGAVEESCKAIASEIAKAQIVMLPGGFSAGDEPDGSGKFIATMFRNPYIKEAVRNLIKQRDGLMLGICNGFQALIKLGLVPYGDIVDLSPDSPTLTFNKIGRHISCLVQTKVVSTLSPWFANAQAGDMHTIAVSHGEGRFVASRKLLLVL
jgi:phosphoribosylformylglycinamidine synthase